MLQKPQKHEKHDFWDFENFEILDRDFWNFRFAIIFELKLKNTPSYDFLKIFFTYSEAYELSEKKSLQNDKFFQKIEKSIWKLRDFGKNVIYI